MKHPAVTWAALATGLVSAIGAAAPTLQSIGWANIANAISALVGPQHAHQISAACSLLSSASLVIAAVGHSIVPPKAPTAIPNPLLYPAVQTLAAPAFLTGMREASVAATRVTSTVTASAPLIVATSPVAPAETETPQMANLFASLLAKFVAPEEHTLGKALAAAYAANKPQVIAAIGADEAKAAAALEADAQVWTAAAFNAVPDGALLLPILGGAVNAEADALIAKGVAAAGGYTPLIEAYADKVVAAVVAQLEAA